MRLPILVLFFGCCNSLSIHSQVSSLLSDEDPSVLSKEIVAYIMHDVEAGIASPIDAYYNILDLMEEGTVFKADCEEFLGDLKEMMDQQVTQVVLLQEFADNILNEIIEDVTNCEATFAQADAQGRVMVNAGVISQEKYQKFYQDLKDLNLTNCP